MRAPTVHYFLFLAVFMLAAKPFVGFSVIKDAARWPKLGIVMKSFTKRKIEYVEGGNFDISSVHKQLANPLVTLTVLFAVFLNLLFPFLFRKAKQVTAGLLSDIHLSLFPPLHKYLFSGQLII
jgi:hypothetical protein